MTAPDLSVLLTSWNTAPATARCLESLRAVAGDLSLEVVAVDNGSVDGSAELLASAEGVTLIRNERNLGFAAAMNQAYRRSTAPLVLLLNSDVEFHPGSLTRLVDFLRTHPEADGVSPRYENPDGTFQQHYVQLPSFAACLALWTVLKKVPHFRRELHRFEMRGEDFSRPRLLSSASCVLFRREILGADAIFDEHFPIYWNDAVLTRDLEAAGHQLWMIPDATVTHTRGESCRSLGPSMRFRHLLGGLIRYLERTEPKHRLVVFRAVLTADYLLKTALGRTTTLAWRDLRAALHGDVGPLPDGDTRDWVVLAGRASVEPSPAIRVLHVDPPGSRAGRRFAVRAVDPGRWEATLPAAIPVGRRLAPIRLVNGRIAAARLRRWLDTHPGARTLRVDPAHEFLVGWLGEDMRATIDEGPAAEPVRA